MSPIIRSHRLRDVAVVALALSAALDLTRSVAGLVAESPDTADSPLSPMAALAFAVVGVAFTGALALGLYTRFRRLFAVALGVLTAASIWGVIVLPGRFTFLSGVDVLLGFIALGGLVLTAASPGPTAQPAAPVEDAASSIPPSTPAKSLRPVVDRSLSAPATSRPGEATPAAKPPAKTVPALIVGVILVVGLNAAIHRHLNSPAVAADQTVQDVIALWTRTFGVQPILGEGVVSRPRANILAALLLASIGAAGGVGCSRTSSSHVARALRLGPAGLMQRERRRRIEAFMSPESASRPLIWRAPLSGKP